MEPKPIPAIFFATELDETAVGRRFEMTNDAGSAFGEVNGAYDYFSVEVSPEDFEKCDAELRLTAAKIERAYNCHDELLAAAKASQQCITDFLKLYQSGCSMQVLDLAAESLKKDALPLIRAAIAKAEGLGGTD